MSPIFVKAYRAARFDWQPEIGLRFTCSALKIFLARFMAKASTSSKYFVPP